jgi:ubiquitin C-terminal hydrolase
MITVRIVTTCTLHELLGKQISIGEQKDINEFYNFFVERLQEGLEKKIELI